MLTRETAAFLPHSKNVQSSNYDGAGPFCAEFPCSLCACIGLLWSTTPSNMPNSDQGTGSDLEWSLGVTFAHCSLRMDSMFRYVVHCMICDLNKDASSKTNLLHYAECRRDSQQTEQGCECQDQYVAVAMMFIIESPGESCQHIYTDVACFDGACARVVAGEINVYFMTINCLQCLKMTS